MTTIKIRRLANGTYRLDLAGDQTGMLRTQIPTLDEARRRARVWRDNVRVSDPGGAMTHDPDMWEIRTPSGRLEAEAESYAAALVAVRTLVEDAHGAGRRMYRVGIFAPRRQTLDWAYGLIR